MNAIRIPLLYLQDRISTGISSVVSRLCLQAELKPPTGDHRWPQTQLNMGLLPRTGTSVAESPNKHSTSLGAVWVTRYKTPWEQRKLQAQTGRRRRASKEGLWVLSKIRHYTMDVLFWLAPFSFALTSHPWLCNGRIALSGSALLQGSTSLQSTPLHINDVLQTKYWHLNTKFVPWITGP